MSVQLPQVFNQPAKTFSEVWLKSLTITAQPNRESFTISAALFPSTTKADGSKELASTPKTMSKRVKWADLTTEQLALVMGVVQYVSDLAYAEKSQA